MEVIIFLIAIIFVLILGVLGIVIVYKEDKTLSEEFHKLTKVKNKSEKRYYRPLTSGYSGTPIEDEKLKELEKDIDVCLGSVKKRVLDIIKGE